uniref:Rho-GAP domain-containing protein n=1 Tax=Ditylenchus dipsaci TaxID=166011 RepID=A0A915DJE0_9BILA
MLSFRGLCVSDCELVIHERCRALAPLPCIPFVHTPQKQKQARPRLADYCPNTRPQIPALLIRCVVQIEKGYLTKEGIYRTPGTMSEVNRLMEAFSSRFVPNLNNYDPDVIAGCIKKFLSELREALIPTSSYKEFVRAAESGNRDQLIDLVNGLPIPNRDTLAYMCAHLQKIASQSSINKMPLENLAACIGPTIVGPNLSVKKGLVQTGDVLEETGEMRRKNTVLLELLKLDNEFWTNVTNYPSNDVISTPHAVNRTPAPAAALSARRNVRPREFDADKSFLGPVTKTPPHHGGGGLLVQPVRTANKMYFNRPY